MNPDIWGPPAWTFLHYVTTKYPECPSTEDKKHMRQFFTELGYVLPCFNCRDHYKTNITKRPLTDTVLSSRQGLSEWLIDIHNDVNVATNKPTLTYAEAFNYINGQFRGTTSSNLMKFLPGVLLMVVIIVIAFMCLVYMRKMNLH